MAEDAPRRRRPPLWLVLVLALLVSYLGFWPVSITPTESWSPPSAPDLEGPYAENAALAKAEIFKLTGGVGPEDIAVDAQGRIYGGLVDGRIVRLAPDGTGQETFSAIDGGRPLGLAWDAEGRLLVADANRGLVRISVDKKGLDTVEVLSSECDGVPYGFADDVDVGPDGTVYFTDASSKYGVEDYKLDLMEHAPNGRLLAWDPKTKATRLVADKLYFANGVAVVPGGESVLMTETSRYRVVRVWTQGPKAGQTEVVIENLPGFPDGISRGAERDGKPWYWIAIASPRDGLVDNALLPTPFLRKVVVRLPELLQPAPARVGFVLGITLDGTVVANLQDHHGESFSPVTSVEEVGKKLYLGSLSYEGLARIDAP